VTGDDASMAFIGLPTTGKSTYIGALWQIIQDDLDQTVVELSTSGDRSYLQELGDAVAQLRPVRRTDVDSTEGMLLEVALDGELRVRLDVPDMSGESVRLLVEERRWHANLSAVLQRCSSILFFVHPSQITNAFRANLTSSLLEELTAPASGSEVAEAPPSSAERSSVPDFHARDACTSAKAIDILENSFLLRGASIRKVGLLVSAWDLVDERLTPRTWAERELPAVVTYLESLEGVEVALYGISAQGGELGRDRQRLLDAGRVRERAYAVDADGTRLPLSAPISWAVRS